MNTTADDFLTWALDASRTLEERFAILRLFERVYQCHYTGPDRRPTNFEAERLKQEDRRFNAAYEPVVKEADLRRIAGLLPKVRDLYLNDQQDRPLRDLSVLRFLPGLTSLTLGQVEVESLDILHHLPALQSLHLHGFDRAEDYTALAACRELTTLHLWGQHPWPVFTGLETLPRLENLHWGLPVRVFTEIPCLPALKKLELKCWNSEQLAGCLRDFGQLPEMPLLEVFWGGAFFRLDGIERFPRLRTARISGFFRHLRPLASMPALTHLRIVCDEMRDISAAARLPVLHQFALHSIRPQDWTTLMDSTSLREVFATGCETPQPDLDTLRLFLPPCDDLFGTDAPRPLPPLRLLGYHPQGRATYGPPDDAIPETGPEGWHGCQFMRESESWWTQDLIEAALEEAGLGKLKGLRFNNRRRRDAPLHYSSPHHSHRSFRISLLRVEAISRVREVVSVLRGALSRTRYPWHVCLSLDAEPDADEWDEDWRDSEDTPQQRAIDHLLEEQRHEREAERLRLFLADQHRLTLLQEQGTQDIPEDIGPRRLAPEKPLPPIFKPPPAPDKPADADEDDEEKDFFADDGGGIAEAAPDEDDDQDEKWLPPVELGDPNVNWNGLCIFLVVTESAVWCPTHRGDPEATSYLLDLPYEAPPQEDPA